MRIENFNPKVNDAEIYAEAMNRLEAAANAVLRRAKANCPVGKVRRPVAKRGAGSGKPWTAREPGSLKNSIRVIRKYGDQKHNVWIIAGNKNVHYAQIVEFRTPFLRPALYGSSSEIATIIKHPTYQSGRSYIAKGGRF